MKPPKLGYISYSFSSFCSLPLHVELHVELHPPLWGVILMGSANDGWFDWVWILSKYLFQEVLLAQNKRQSFWCLMKLIAPT